MSLAERVRPMVREDILITHMISDWRKMDTPSVNEYTCWVNQWQEGFIEAGKLNLGDSSRLPESHIFYS